ncbi:Ribosomal protein S6 kinase alpha-3 [Leucoagaricus sp. SymC.cos]|nr:Ribosomal protein S6 kinase alpha-3 [Leucoagaricus sp. SymC.cos]
MEYIHGHSQSPKLPIITGITNGLHYLHQNDIVHGDLKPSNILIDDNGHPLLFDFNRSCLIGYHSDTTRRNGTVRYQAPELFEEDAKYTKASDVYAFGMTCSEIWTGVEPFAEFPTDATIILQVVLEKARPCCPSHVTEETKSVWALLEACWVEDPEERWDMGKVLHELGKLIETTDGSRLSKVGPGTSESSTHLLSNSKPSIRDGPPTPYYTPNPSFSSSLDSATSPLPRFSDVPLSSPTVNSSRGDFTYARCRDSLLENLDQHATIRKSLSGLGGEKAQHMVDFLNKVTMDLPPSQNDKGKKRVLDLLCALAKAAQVFPKCYEVSGVQLVLGTPEYSGGYGDIYKGKYRGHSVGIKVPRALQPGETDSLLKLLDVITGLEYLHLSNIIHTDLKPDNVLVSDSGRAMIGDFGVSNIALTVRKSVGSTGTTYYTAPELLLSLDGKPIPTVASDVWSFGCLCYQVLTDKEPFKDRFNMDGQLIYAFIQQKVEMQLPKTHGIDDEIRELVERGCCAIEPKQRLESREIIRMLERRVPKAQSGSHTPADEHFVSSPAQIFSGDIEVDCKSIHDILDNVLVSDSGRAMIGDFGVSNIALTVRKSVGSTGTTYYTAPELLLSLDGKPIPTVASDVWSFGCLCYQVLTDKEPFKDRFNIDGQLIYAFIQQKVEMQLPKTHGIDDEIRELVERGCCAIEPKQRLESREIIRMLERRVPKAQSGSHTPVDEHFVSSPAQRFSGDIEVDCKSIHDILVR